MTNTSTNPHIDDIITCISFLLHTHVQHNTDIERLRSTIEIGDLSPITQDFLTQNGSKIQNTIETFGDTLFFNSRVIYVILRKQTSISGLYHALIKEVNESGCDETHFLKTQQKLFDELYSKSSYQFEPKPQFCTPNSYTWSINKASVCVPRICNKAIDHQWKTVEPMQWANSRSYAYKFRSISVPLHEVLHINQNHLDLYEDEWEASYYSFDGIDLDNKSMKFATGNISRFFVFHESLVRNLYFDLPKCKTNVIFEWHKQRGSIHHMNANSIHMLDESVIKANDKKMNTFAKSFVALQRVFDIQTYMQTSTS
tara:strand:- start:1485 stop:2423 length:939 start_codon:yes stop_codon:yes gene_type:complete